MDRVDRAQQEARELALADPELPAERREHHVHVPDERPDDVVGGELARRDPRDRPALLVRDRRPHDEVDDRLGDHPDHVEVVGDPVLELLRDRDPHRGRVEIDPGARGRGEVDRRVDRGGRGLAARGHRSSSVPGVAPIGASTSAAAAAAGCLVVGERGRVVGGRAGSRWQRAREHVLDHVLDRRVLDRQVGDVELAQHLRGDLRGVGTADPDRRPPVLAAHHLAVLRQVGRTVEQRDADRLGRRELVGQRGEGAVEQDPAVVDDDHPLAQRLDVGHVVARQQHRRARPLVVLGEERADPLLGGDVEPDRRLVEEQHRRPMQQGAADLGLHPLPERQVADRLGDQVAEVEELDQLVAHAARTPARGRR